MKKFLENYFYKKNYFIFTPKIYFFGGFFESFLNGTKISKSIKKKVIIVVPFIDIKNQFFDNPKKNDYVVKKKFDYHLIKKYFYKLTLLEKIFSILLSTHLNFNLLLKKLKIKTLLALIFNKEFIDKLIFENLGYYNDFNTYKISNFKQVHKEKPESDIFFQNKEFVKKFSAKKFISLCVKDINYSKIKDISSNYCADINTYKETIDYLINKNFSVIRIGEPSMPHFSYTHDNFFDFVKSKNYYTLFFNAVQYSQFYLGTGASHTYIPEYFTKPKIITNSSDYIYLNNSFSYNNLNIFKSCFSVSQKKILSFAEIYQNLDVLNCHSKHNKDYIFLDNSNFEILNLIEYFFQKKTILDVNHKQNLSEFQTMRHNCLADDRISRIKASEYYHEAITDMIPSYLQNFLYPNKYLEELSKFTSKHLNL